jgi:predicted DNA-binding transcriptional regulator AlpA
MRTSPPQGSESSAVPAKSGSGAGRTSPSDVAAATATHSALVVARGAGTSSLSRWLSIRQIAVDLGVSTSTAYKWSSRGSPWFPRAIRLHNGDIRVRRDWYEEWLAALEEP